MPSTPMKNLLYRLALPLMAPSPHKQMIHKPEGFELSHLPYYEHLLTKHRVWGASLLLDDGKQRAQVYTATMEPRHACEPNTIFRVASITKMATALVVLRCVDQGLFALESPVLELLPDIRHGDKLAGVQVKHLLSHTSGLCDIPALDHALRNGQPFDTVLADEHVRSAEPGQKMIYSNLGFGLLGSMLEHVTGQSVETVFQECLFKPLGMRASLDASTLNERDMMPIMRVLPYRPGTEVTVTTLGRKSIATPDPLLHFAHTAGAMYTDAPSLAVLLKLIAKDGEHEGQQLISKPLIGMMKQVQASTKTRTYGLGLVILNRPEISQRTLYGHQGFAYGCVDGAFIEEGTDRMVIFLNGGASEARTGKLGLVNRDVLIWALNKEMPSWT